jgi:uncharacterized protein (TIGR03435 family)
VASVKIVETPPVGAPEGFALSPRRSGGSFHWVTNMPLLIRYAFRLQAWRITGAEVDDYFYLIDAKGNPEATDDQVRAMFQGLLRERFQMAFHRETREQSGYALYVARNGLRIKAVKPEDPPGDLPAYWKGRTDLAKALEGRTALTVEGGWALTGRRVSMTQVAEALQEPLRAPVVDKTGIDGKYYFGIRFARDNNPDSQLPDLATALREELGLRLEKEKLPVEMLVVDRIQAKPIEN